MNDFFIAALAFAIASILFMVGAGFRDQPERYRVVVAVGLAIMSMAFAILFYDLGNLLDRLKDAAREFQTSFETTP